MSNTQKKNVPELRFPEFEGEWEEKQLGEVAKIYDGTHQTPKYTNEGIKFLSVENIKTLNSSKYISEEAFEKEFKIRPEFGDILMTRIGDIGTPNIVSSNEKFAYYVSLALLKTKNLNSYFLKNLILSSSIQNELWRKTLHVAFPKKINKNEIGKIKINYPKKQEQQKIGKFFSKLDRQIELEEQKLELLQQQKKGYMQKIFSQELRFKDENGNDYPEWENVMLQKVLKDKTEGIKRGPFGGTLKKDIFIESGYAVYEQRNAIYDISNFRYYINENKYKEMQSFSVQPNDIIMSCSGTIGRLSLIPQNFTKGIINQALIRFRTNHKIRSEFFLIFMRSNQMQRKILEANPGSAITNLVPVKELKLIPFPLPVKFEQDKISQFILIINRRIEQSEKKIESLKNRKQGFLQKLFV
ncbi:restriction endonuclease subunit S [Staphylococcus argenteus]|uniref:restriction endonuclease subunit S n=1 Tax=Staphylococcus argenteus TaxID=985002 RepID=UPI00091C8AE0|nr:restriction endonuclease subunit S [Staphylococcus argenteus]MCG9855225.1 restriction endonuclease subunit S [Staphylococcus argenteus]SGX33164.1 Type I restriction-modification system, specificity subunit S [Staphylococcus argenteus]SGX63781.1 Type I restriction-modification system, specificity subunit S [Staphylococcus argenteus]SHD35802.1 Type I restriction-modification system, specificity subunit S [Staphylococcus argenteus]GJF50601.1 restriction endonuclease subunit S [Staphylococcus a